MSYPVTANKRFHVALSHKIMSMVFTAGLALAGCAVGNMEEEEIYGHGETPENMAAGEGELYDENPYEPYSLGKADSPEYEIPEIPDLVNPEIIVSLDALNILLMDRATGYSRVYPTGVGKLGSSGYSYTPVGHFATGPDTNDNWWYMASRYYPSYYDGLPFLRLTTLNSRGLATYGMHGPVTSSLIRGYVSSGCMRMAPEDIIELFWAVRNHPSTPVSIQREWIYDAIGQRVDVGSEVILWEPDEEVSYGASIGPMETDEPYPSELPPFVGSPCTIDAECSFSSNGAQGWCYRYGSDTEAQRGFCTISCEGYCPDHPSHATTFCVESEGEGMCVSQSEVTNQWCEDLPGTVTESVSRFVGSSNAPQTEKFVCLPE